MNKFCIYFLFFLIPLFYSCNKKYINDLIFLKKSELHFADAKLDSLYTNIKYWEYKNIPKLKENAKELIKISSNKYSTQIGNYYLIKAEYYQNANQNIIDSFKNIFKTITDERLDFIKYEICFYVNNFYQTENDFVQNSEWINDQFEFIAKENSKLEREAIIYNQSENFNLNNIERNDQLKLLIPIMNQKIWGFYHSKIYKDLAALKENSKLEKLSLLQNAITNNQKYGLYILNCDLYMHYGYTISGDSGIYYCNKAINLAVQTGYTSGLRNFNTVLGHVYLKQESFNNAYTYYLKSLEIDAYSKQHIDSILDLANAGLAYSKIDSLHNIEAANKLYFDKAINSLQFNDAFLKENILSKKLQSLPYNDPSKPQLQNQLNQAEIEVGKREAFINNFYLSMRLRQKENDFKLSKLSIANKLNTNRLLLLSTFLLLLSSLFIFYFIFSKQKLRHEQKLNENASIILNQNKELQTLITQLENSNKNLEHFAHVAAHDLQSPLYIINKGIFILEKKLKGKLDVEEKEIIAHLITASSDFMKMINSLLMLSTFTQNLGKTELIDLKKLVYSIKSLLLENSTIENVNILCDPKIPYIEAHYSLIMQLFLNLISNSIKYKNENKLCQIEIGLVKINNNYAELSIKDNGVGIAKNNIPMVFDLFYRASISEKPKGNGIGLATCKKIIEFYKGTIKLESELNVGTTIFLSLPIS